MGSPALQIFPASGQGLKSGNNRVVRAIQFLTAGAIYKVGTQRSCVPTGKPILFYLRRNCRRSVTLM
jgi:hypothetical protein